MHRLTTAFQKTNLFIKPRGITLGKATYTTSTEAPLSNCQKFKQVQPSPKLYEKLEKLGFGSLLRTKRYSGLNKEKERRQQKELKFNDWAGLYIQNIIFLCSLFSLVLKYIPQSHLKVWTK
ncbi:unnamed protein product [Rhizopus stolonifer]